MFYRTYRKIIVSITFIVIQSLCNYVHVLFHCIGLISPSTLAVGYYHSLLIRDFDPYLVMDKMCSNGLLAPSDQEMILAAGHSIHQRNWLLLEHVRHMAMQAMVKFCEFVREILPQVGLQLVASTYVDTTCIAVLIFTHFL